MITEDYVSFETAKLLKEKGFDEDIDLWYDENGGMFFQHKYDINRDWRVVVANSEVYECPTLQMAMKWLREKHHLHISLFQTTISWWSFQIFNLLKADGFGCKPAYTACRSAEWTISYEQACEAAIKYCLENLI